MERDVIQEERRSTVDGDPVSVLSEQMLAVLYRSHPYRRPVLGWADEMSKLSRKDATAFYKRFYAPNNAVLVVAGDVTPEEVRPLAEATYGRDERNPAASRPALALDQWYADAFANRAYGRPVNGTPESLARLTRDDVEALHARLFARDVVKIVIARDIDRRAAADALDAIFGSLPEKAQLTDAQRVEPQSVPAPVVIDKDFPLASTLFGLPGLRGDDPDFPALQVLNHIIGSGNFDARLMEEIRVKRGLAYSIKTVLARDSMTSLLLGGFATKNENMGAALGVVKDVLANMARDGPTPSQFDNAKLYLTGSFLLDFDTSAKVAGSLLHAWLDGEAPDYLRTRNQKITSVTLDDVKRVAGAVLKVDRLIVTIIGRPHLEP